jgi:hypothetical protein
MPSPEGEGGVWSIAIVEHHWRFRLMGSIASAVMRQWSAAWRGGEMLLLFQEYCMALQAVIDAGADVRTVIDGRSRGVLNIEMVDAGMLVCSISSESPEEQRAVLPALTRFTVEFPEF